MTEFYFNAANPGSGKTEAALRWAMSQCADLSHKAIFVLQTTALIDELAIRAKRIKDECSLHSVDINAIHSNHDVAGVKSRIIAHCTSSPHDQPEVLIVTLRAFLDISPWPNQHAWHHVFVDEAFNPFEDLSRQLVENHCVITDRLSLTDPDAEFSSLRPKHGAGVRASTIDPYKRADEINKLLHSLFSRVINPNFTVYAHVPTWKGIITGEFAARDPRLFFYSEINPSAFAGFQSVTFMGAWLQNHAFFRLWSSAGHSFSMHPQLRRLIRNRAWNRSEDTIFYFTERHWTGTYASEKLSDGLTPLEHIDSYLRQELQGFEFGWTKNLRHRLSYEGTYMPPRSAGLNCYDHLECLNWLASMLPHPNMWRFMNWRGLADEAVRTEFYWLPLAQFMARGADRRPDYEGRMIKVVPDLPAARFLQPIFGSRVQQLGSIPGDSRGLIHTS